TALRDGRHVRADTTRLLGFTTAPNNAALHRALSGQFTNFCHNIFLRKGARETTSEIPGCKDYLSFFEPTICAKKIVTGGKETCLSKRVVVPKVGVTRHAQRN